MKLKLTNIIAMVFGVIAYLNVMVGETEHGYVSALLAIAFACMDDA